MDAPADTDLMEAAREIRIAMVEAATRVASQTGLPAEAMVDAVLTGLASAACCTLVAFVPPADRNSALLNVMAAMPTMMSDYVKAETRGRAH